MILIDAGTRTDRSFDARLLLADQMAARGHVAALDDRTIPDHLTRAQRYEAAPYLIDAADIEAGPRLLIGAEALSDAALDSLRAHATSPDHGVAIMGRFANSETAAQVRLRVTYAIGRAPYLVNLTESQRRPLLADTAFPLTGVPLGPARVTSGPGATGPGATGQGGAGQGGAVLGGAGPGATGQGERAGQGGAGQGERAAAGARPRVIVILGPDALADRQTLAELAALDHHPGLRLCVIASAAQKDKIAASRFHGLMVLGLSEVPPLALARMADLAVLYGHAMPAERLLAALLTLMQSHRPVIDATDGAVLAGGGAPVLRGPVVLSALSGYLDHAVLPHLKAIADGIAKSTWLDSTSIALVEMALGLDPPPAAALDVSVPSATAGPLQQGARQARSASGSEPDKGAAPAPALPRVLFLPTNGVGLGHAQRCLQIADAMSDRTRRDFAAFPSCTGFVADHGYPCLPMVPKSDMHGDSSANDLVNHLRLRRTLGPGDTLVFDGGHVFGSVWRNILDASLRSVWIRRGLWKAAQINSTALHRDRIFDRVIVPDEAFEELNGDYTFGPHIRHVGPIVQSGATDGQTERPEMGDRQAADVLLADRLRARFGPFDRLVVTMLGGGIASDRSAQIQTLCNLLERRDDCLHLVVVWPGSRISAGLTGWRRSKVVQTRDALGLARLADLVVSAAGYNSVHEILYHRIPAILVPQMASFIDDQDRRARAAAVRGLVRRVAATDLVLLERALRACLDGDGADLLRRSLAAAVLPTPGNAAAATMIEEVALR